MFLAQICYFRVSGAKYMDTVLMPCLESIYTACILPETPSEKGEWKCRSNRLDCSTRAQKARCFSRCSRTTAVVERRKIDAKKRNKDKERWGRDWEWEGRESERSRRIFSSWRQATQACVVHSACSCWITVTHNSTTVVCIYILRHINVYYISTSPPRPFSSSPLPGSRHPTASRRCARQSTSGHMYGWKQLRQTLRAQNRSLSHGRRYREPTTRKTPDFFIHVIMWWWCISV